MTASTLLLYITAALLLQVAVGVAIALARRHASQNSPTAAASAGSARPAPPALRDFRVVRREFADPSETQCSFHLAPVDGQALPPFEPGQFLTFTLDVPDEAGAASAVTRCYSLSDSPDGSAYRVTIKRVPNGRSSGFFHDRVQVGDILRARPPAGHFTLEPDHSLPVVLVAGGIGITPLFPMLRALMSETPARAVHFYYGVRRAAEGAFRAELEALRAAHPSLRLHWVYSQPDSTDDLGAPNMHRGRIDIALLKRTIPHGLHHFYICGPASMLNDLVPALQDWGVPATHIHFEAFGPSTVKLRTAANGADDANAATHAVAATPIEIEFRASGRTLVWDGRESNLLEFAERHAVSVQSGCRSGSCGSCETKLLSGEISYANTPDHDITPGSCLLCVGRPVTSVTLEA